MRKEAGKGSTEKQGKAEVDRTKESELEIVRSRLVCGRSGEGRIWTGAFIGKVTWVGLGNESCW